MIWYRLPGPTQTVLGEASKVVSKKMVSVGLLLLPCLRDCSDMILLSWLTACCSELLPWLRHADSNAVILVVFLIEERAASATDLGTCEMAAKLFPVFNRLSVSIFFLLSLVGIVGNSPDVTNGGVGLLVVVRDFRVALFILICIFSRKTGHLLLFAECSSPQFAHFRVTVTEF